MKNPALIKNNMPDLMKHIKSLAKFDVLVGIPSGAGDEPGAEISLASVGYIQEYGSAAKNIPARPFLIPGIADAKDKITAAFKKGALAAIKGDAAGVENCFTEAGLAAVPAVKLRIDSIIPPPLAPGTLYNRKHRKERPNSRTTPLRDKDDMYKAIQFVVRRK